jgi:intracellular multiplication protein IcmO
MEKRVKEEARSIVANCNIKIFGKLEDPSQTKDLFDKTVSSSFVTEVTSFSTQLDSMTKSYYDNASASVQTRSHASYDELRSFKDGEAVVCFSDTTVVSKIYYSKPGLAKAMRVTRFMPLPPPSETLLRHIGPTMRLRDLMVKKDWSAMRADVLPPVSNELKGAINGYLTSQQSGISETQSGMMAVAGSYVAANGWPEPALLPEAAPTPATIPAAAAYTEHTDDTTSEGNGITPTSSSALAAAPKTPAASPFAQGKSPFSSFVKNDDADASPPITTHQDMPEQAVSPEPAVTSSSVSDEQIAQSDTEKTPITLSAQTIDTIEEAAEEAHDTLVRSHV